MNERRTMMWICAITAASILAPAARADDYLDEVDRGTRWQKPAPLTPAESSARIGQRLSLLAAEARVASAAQARVNAGDFDSTRLLAPEANAMQVESIAPVVSVARAATAGRRLRLSEIRARLSATATTAQRAAETTRASRAARPPLPTPNPDPLSSREAAEVAVAAEATRALGDVGALSNLLRSVGAEADPELPTDENDKAGRRALNGHISPLAFAVVAGVPAAVAEGGGVVVVSRAPAFTLKDLAAAGLTLRRKFGPTADKNYASLEYDRDITAGSHALELEACLRYQKSGGFYGQDGSAWRIDPVLALDGNLTSSDADDSNFWSLRAGAAFRWDGGPDSWSKGKPTDRHVRRLATYVVGTYTESQDGKVRQLYADIVFNPVYGPWGLGVRRGHESVLKDECGNIVSGLADNGCCLAPRNWISGQWNLEVHAKAGENLETGDGKNREKLLLNGVATISATLYFDAIGRALGAGWDSKLYPYLEFAYDMHWKPVERDTYDDLYQLTFKFPLNEDVALTATYRNGVYGPKLEEVEKFKISLTFGF